MTVDEHTVDLASGNAFYRSAPTQVSGTPLFIHGLPMSSDIWLPLLERTGGIALDLPGFGRSDKGGHLDYSGDGLARAVTELIDRLHLDDVSLVGHGWGAVVAMAAADARTSRLVLISPFATEAPWPRAARICRTRGLGELAMGAVTRTVLARMLRRGSPQAFSDAQIKTVWEQFDQGTQRAILRLHRSDPPDHAPPSVPALVLYGDQDPWLDQERAARVAQRVGAEALAVAGAGHWPWLNRSDVVDTIVSFLGP